MAKCWTCGSSISDLCYRCSACEDALRDIETSLSEGFGDIESSLSEGFANLAEIQERGFNRLSANLSEIATILEWGFEELSWQLQQQTEVLRSIDHALKTPSETKANEWRLHAEELRRRGVLEESEEFFLKALNEYRLDYRIYVGLAETYLQMNKFDKAKTHLEKSLPHAPKGRLESGLEKSHLNATKGSIEISEGTGKIRDLLQQGRKIEAIKEYRAQTGVGLTEAKDAVERMVVGELGSKKIIQTITEPPTASDFDWKSYSYRLIGHIYACEEDHIKALEALHTSVKLSPNYADGFYDFAQHVSLVSDDVVDRICSQTLREWGGNWASKDYNLVCFLSLQKAIEVKPVYFYLARKERNFDRRREIVELALKNLLDNARGRVETTLLTANTILSEEARRAISKATHTLNKSRAKGKLKSGRFYEDAKSKIKLANEKLDSVDYRTLLDAQLIAKEAYNLMNAAKDKAREEFRHYEKIRGQRAWNELKELHYFILGCGVLGAIGGCTVGIFSDTVSKSSGAGVGFLLGALIGLIVGIYDIINYLN
jgi:tetratricopeptide (TPR) repeat protein